MVAAFTVLISGGAQIARHKPPIPERVVGPSGQLVLTGDDIRAGQRQYLSRGGQQTGSIWGHGAYLIVLSLLPAGIYQLAIGVKHGLWYARSPEVTGSAFLHAVTWARVVPDLVFDAGAVALLAFVVRAIARDLALRRAAARAGAPERAARRAA